MCQACRVSLRDHLDAPARQRGARGLAAHRRRRRRRLRRPRARRGPRGGRARGGGRLRRRAAAPPRDGRRQRGGGAGRGNAVPGRGARRPPTTSRPSSAGCCPPAGTPPTWPPTPCTARSARPPATARRALRASPRRTLVAMSGGVDSAAAAQLALDAGDDVVAVTLELWADPATDDERSCCSPQAVLGARALAHGMGIPHVTLDLRERFRADGGGRVPGRVRRRPHAQPVRALQRRGALRRDARPGRTRSAPRGSPPATTRASRATTQGPLLRAGADPRKDQSYMLARLEPDAARAALVPARRADQGRGARRSRAPPACRWPTGARARTSASRPASAARRFLRRHGAGRAAPARADRGRATAASSAATTASTASRSASAAASAWPAREPLYVLAKDARTATGHGRAARGAGRHAR